MAEFASVEQHDKPEKEPDLSFNKKMDVLSSSGEKITTNGEISRTDEQINGTIHQEASIFKSSNSLNHDDTIDSENGDKLSGESFSESGIEVTHPNSVDPVINDSPSVTDEAIDSANSSFSDCLQKDVPNDTPISSEELNDFHSNKEFTNDNVENIGIVNTIEFAEEETSCLSSDDNGLDGSGTESDLEDNVPLDEDNHESAYSMKLKLRQENPVLPETVTVLKTPEGSKVYLVGTAHFSLSSQEDVAVTIQATQPDIVMVELCKSRVNILSLDEETVLEESKNMNFEKMHAAIKQNGVIQGIMYLLLLSMSAHLTKQLGMAPGSEFRKAFMEAKKVPGCLVHLGDRPIQITLQRALASLSWWQKLRLAWYMLTSKEPISKEEVEKCKKKDLLEEMLAEMTGEFPALSHVFVKERDIYLAYSLKLAASPVRSLSAPSVVVGVVGIGHVPGIVENWDKVTEYDILPILRVPESSLTTKVLRHTFRISLLSLTVWGCYRFLLPTSISEVISPRRPIEWLSQFFNH